MSWSPRWLPHDMGGAPPLVLRLLENFEYKEGWTFAASAGHLRIWVQTVNSLKPENPISIVHDIPMSHHLSMTTDMAVIEEWLLQQIIKVETHEACEFFTVAGKKPYFPDHDNPYKVQRAKQEVTF